MNNPKIGPVTNSEKSIETSIEQNFHYYLWITKPKLKKGVNTEPT